MQSQKLVGSSLNEQFVIHTQIDAMDATSGFASI